jgi:hypothetical protein
MPAAQVHQLRKREVGLTLCEILVLGAEGAEHGPVVEEIGQVQHANQAKDEDVAHGHLVLQHRLEAFLFLAEPDWWPFPTK